MAIIKFSNDIETCIYPKIDDIDKKIEEFNNKINRIARDQAKKAWINSRKGRKK